MRIARRVTLGTAILSLTAGVVAAHASPQMLTDVKKAGMPAKNCQYCHTEALPKKDTFKPESLNDRGKFLSSDMKQRSLKTPDLGKLKDFPGGPEQK